MASQFRCQQSALGQPATVVSYEDAHPKQGPATMGIERSDVVDGLGISQIDGKVVLTISDHLQWDEPTKHFELLEEKVGAYLAFVKSGQLYETLPAAHGRDIRIELVCEHAPNALAATFLIAAKKQLNAVGVEFFAAALPEGY
ncbi:hypothetical protein JYK21_13375 [Ralstonia pickettii]|nr:hypothetical protein [Ralstonia pickettii]